MNSPLNMSRRTFIKATAYAVGGLVIAFSIPNAKRFALPGISVANAAEDEKNYPPLMPFYA